MSKDDRVLCVAVGGFVAVVAVVIACCDKKGYPRATVITPNATYENVQVNYHTSKYGTTYNIYTDYGNVMTITGSSTIVWNANENNK